MKQQITTTEELDALPVGSVILDRGGMALQKTHWDLSGTGWNASNGSRDIERHALERECFPAIVLHEGDPR